MGEFRHVPAGVEKYAERRQQLSVAYVSNKSPKTFFGKGFKQWRLSDRTVTLTNSTYAVTKSVSVPQDIIVPISSPTFIKNIGIKTILANPIHGNFTSVGYDSLGIDSIIDSGGFQLLTSTVDFVSPDDVITRYNLGGTIGMPLDLPVRSIVESQFFDTVSHLIKANDLYIEPKLKTTKLALISHGSTLALRKKRLDILDRPNAKVVAIAGLGSTPHPGVNKLHSGIENLMYVLTRYRKTAEYFHVLGVTSKFWIFIYSLIAHRNYVKCIGADSVSHRIASISGGFDTPSFNIEPLAKGAQHYYTVPTCQCPVCSSVGDIRLLGEASLLESHNLWIKAKQAKFLSNIAKIYTDGLINITEVYNTLNLPISLLDFIPLVTYVENTIASGKFVPFRNHSSKQSLFSTGYVSKPDPKVVAHYKAVIARYEDFHKISFSKGLKNV